ncbi:hypothetical protein, partial [Streptomyces sp. URMC 123]|uniref:hypothetical protein n=1 Tax=Streptomyces sp. URMC 123 TaxID=3423403 RepID=UPI003F198D9C
MMDPMPGLSIRRRSRARPRTGPCSRPDAELRFPVVESFAGDRTENPHWRLAGGARLDGSLRLTPDAPYRSGSALLDQPFPSSLAFTLTFDYACERGAVPPPDAATALAPGPGDGFCVFLIDGNRTTGPGGHGAGLGYSRSRIRGRGPEPVPGAAPARVC